MCFLIKRKNKFNLLNWFNRLIEFGDTPSSALTLEEFMTVDLEEEQDPPAFKIARKKDRERLQKVLFITIYLSYILNSMELFKNNLCNLYF